MTDLPSPSDTEKPEAEPAAIPIPSTLTDEALLAAERLSGLEFTATEHALLRDDLRDYQQFYEQIRAIPLQNATVPAFSVDPRPADASFDPIEASRTSIALAPLELPALPADLEQIAFWPLAWLSRLIQTRQVTSLALTEMYLARLKHFDPLLHCVITLTEERALKSARQSDSEIAAGRYRGPLHGIPWGVKDLLATAGDPTTWGSPIYREQRFDYDATVVERLDAAGAVLVGKLSVGELAMDDVWFGGQTRNPWNLEEGSSGSSAGSASAVAAGLVGFAIGTETYGSIVSPATRCRVSGLRPTFGRVSRHGAMMLSWTMDKIGPIARTVEDCALVFDAIYGRDGRDSTLVDAPFDWPPQRSAHSLRVGYVPAAFETSDEFAAQNRATLDVCRDLHIELLPLTLPEYPIAALVTILLAEAAASFDDLTRNHTDDQMVRQGKEAWPNSFRAARFIPAVEYIQAQRVRTLAMQAMAEIMTGVDVYMMPSFADNNLLLTNLTGHPAVVVPNGVTDSGQPASLTFIGGLYQEADALTVAQLYQDSTTFHLAHPPLDKQI